MEKLLEKELAKLEGVLDFSYYYLTDYGVAMAMDSIESIAGVHTLIFDCNKIRDKGVIALCSSLEKVHHAYI